LKKTYTVITIIILTLLISSNLTLTGQTLNKTNKNQLIVDAGGPYIGYENRSIQFSGNVTGGIDPYHWYWKFGDGQTSGMQNPEYAYNRSGEYTAVLTVTDSSIPYNQNNNTAQVSVYNEDFTPPILEITKPDYYIYFMNEEIRKTSTPIIIGSIDIEVDATDEDSGISHVEFYTGQVYKLLKNTDDTSPYIWTWNEIQFGWRTIKIIAYDKAGNQEKKEIKIWKYF